MNRRRLLGLEGGAFVGLCSGCAAPSQLSTPPATIGPETGLEITDVSDHGGIDVRFEAELFGGTAEIPPEIEFRLTNIGPARQFHFGAIPPFTVVGGKMTGLTLIPDGYGESITPFDPDGPTVPEAYIPESRGDGCWRALARPLVLDYLQSVALDRDEPISARYTLLAFKESDGDCPQSGSHRLTSGFFVDERDGEIESSVTLRID